VSWDRSGYFFSFHETSLQSTAAGRSGLAGMLRPSALGRMRPARHLAVSSRHFAAAACRFDHLGGEQPASMKGRLPVTLFWDGARKRGLGP